MHKEIDESFEFQQKRHDIDLFEYPDTEFKKFKLSAQRSKLFGKSLNVKGNRFYARATTSRTGILDCSKLPRISTTKISSRKSPLLPMVRIMVWCCS